jgi:hypothetical protein
VAAERPAMRAAAGSDRWRPERTHPGRLVDRAVEAGRASGCALSARTASRSSCAPVATAQSPRYQRTTERRPGRARGSGVRISSGAPIKPTIYCIVCFLRTAVGKHWVSTAIGYARDRHLDDLTGPHPWHSRVGGEAVHSIESKPTRSVGICWCHTILVSSTVL